MHTLTRLQSNGSSDPIYLESLPFTIGRFSGNNLALTNLSVSRHHAVIEADGEEIFILDQESANGTFINGKALQAGRNALKGGDIISLGVSSDKVELCFDIDSRVTEEGLPEPLVENDCDLPLVLGKLLFEDDSSILIELDQDSRDVRVLGTLLESPLSRSQFDVLALLCRGYPGACTRDEIRHAGWPKWAGEVSDNLIDTCISEIRKQLQKSGLHHKILQNLRGYGYKLVVSPLEDQEA